MTDNTLPPQVLAALQQGHKIEAIRLMRELTGLGLKEAKDAVEAATAASSADGGLSPGQVKSRGGAWLVAGVLIAAAIAWYLLRTPG